MALVYLLLTAGSMVFVIPLVWMISTSLRPEWEVYSYPPKILPNYFLWQNYVEGWTRLLPFTTFLQNTLTITVGNVTGNLLSCSLAAFGFARLRARGRDFFFTLLISTMMLPWEVTMIPQFVMFTRFLKWGNTFKPLMMPAWFGWPFGIFLLRQFFMTIPLELDDAARIDGASTFRILWQIMLPLVKPALATLAIFAFVGNWNNFMGPLIYLSDMKKYTMAIGLRLFQGQHAVRNQHYLMAVSVVNVAPIIVLFFFAQKQFIQGIALTGIKG
ncbi:MAG: carbohydrate ABC transporter permease [Chloroflexi bacterium]|nr:carbohydrate ABC transporter permease [Chloroflexota bacterium]